MDQKEPHNKDNNPQWHRQTELALNSTDHADILHHTAEAIRQIQTENVARGREGIRTGLPKDEAAELFWHLFTHPDTIGIFENADNPAYKEQINAHRMPYLSLMEHVGYSKDFAADLQNNLPVLADKPFAANWQNLSLQERTGFVNDTWLTFLNDHNDPGLKASGENIFGDPEIVLSLTHPDSLVGDGSHARATNQLKLHGVSNDPALKGKTIILGDVSTIAFEQDGSLRYDGHDVAVPILDTIEKAQEFIRHEGTHYLITHAKDSRERGMDGSPLVQNFTEQDYSLALVGRTFYMNTGQGLIGMMVYSKDPEEKLAYSVGRSEEYKQAVEVRHNILPKADITGQPEEDDTDYAGLMAILNQKLAAYNKDKPDGP